MVGFQSCTAIPGKMPDDFSIDYSSNGGMTPTYQHIIMNLKECRFEAKSKYNEDPLVYTFKIEHNEFELLYIALRHINAFTLKSEQEKVYDRGGEDITYIIAGKTYRVKNSGMNFIRSSDQGMFGESVFLIKDVADKYRP